MFLNLILNPKCSEKTLGKYEKRNLEQCAFVFNLSNNVILASKL